MTRTAAAACLALLLGVSPGPSSPAPDRSQTRPPDPQSDPQQRPVFRAGANFVAVDVYPRRDGRVVQGLSLEDFQVFEDGVRQQVETFEFIEVEPFAPLAERVDPRTIAEADRQAADPRVRVFVLYLDGQNVENLEGYFRATQPALEFLRRAMGPRDMFGVMTPDMRAEEMVLGRRIEMVEELIAAYWKRAFVNEATDLIATAENDYERLLIRCAWTRDEKLIQRLFRLARAERALENLRWLAVRLGGIREFRSHVLLFTGGWDLMGPQLDLLEMPQARARPPQVRIRSGRLTTGGPGGYDAAACGSEISRLAMLDVRRLFQDVLDAADENNVSFYPIDPQGLAAFDDETRQAGWYEPGQPAPPLGTPEAVRLNRERMNALRMLGGETGGRALVGTNNIIEPLHEIADSFASFYLLGYYSTNGAFDGQYRTIDVKTTVDDVDVAARRGYLAPSAEEIARVDAAREAADAPRDTTPFAAAFEAIGRADSPSELFLSAAALADRVVVTAEVAEAVFGRDVDDRAVVEVELADAAGAVLDTHRAGFAAGGRGVQMALTVPAGDAGPWRVTARVEGRAGSISERVEVTRQEPGPLGARRVFRARSARTSPLWPAAQLRFRTAERVHVEWETPGPLDRREARLVNAAGVALPVPVTLAERVVDGRSVLSADLPLAALGAGDYVVEVTATAAGTTVQDFLGVRVVR